VDNAGNIAQLSVWNRADLGDQAYTGLITDQGASAARSPPPARAAGSPSLNRTPMRLAPSLNDGEIGLGSDCTGAADAPPLPRLGRAPSRWARTRANSPLQARHEISSITSSLAGGTRLTLLGTNALTLSGNIDLGTQRVTINQQHPRHLFGNCQQRLAARFRQWHAHSFRNRGESPDRTTNLSGTLILNKTASTPFPATSPPSAVPPPQRQ